MNLKRILLYGTFAGYQIGAFVFTIMVDGHLDLLALLKYIPLFKYITFLGMILIGLDIFWSWKERKDHAELIKMREENEHLKTKLRDIQIAETLKQKAERV
ncbi:MAG: hypothetical protein JST14_10505 [Bacteroidetes bacterium]|nr:hypothetical protein [Bacteroidota bacterium]MBS1977903.1 hypothetical protein [Bacteroidota bacterium]